MELLVSQRLDAMNNLSPSCQHLHSTEGTRKLLLLPTDGDTGTGARECQPAGPRSRSRATALSATSVARGAQLSLFGGSGSDQGAVRPRIARITPRLYGEVEAFLAESVEIYPGIDEWWRNRVVPGIERADRICRIAFIDNKLAAVAIGRLHTKSSKLCTLRVRPEYRGKRIGQRLLESTLHDFMRHGARRVHYTISEAVVAECGGFFQPYGFGLAHYRKDWYARDMFELAYTATRNQVLTGLKNQPVLFDQQDTVVLSIKPKYAALIENGQKLVEFRRQFSPRLKSANALIYVTAPVQEFKLLAQITDVVVGDPHALWLQYGHMSGVSQDEYSRYFAGAATAYALVLNSVASLRKPISLRDPGLVAQGYRPPQSFSVVRANSPIQKVIAKHFV